VGFKVIRTLMLGLSLSFPSHLQRCHRGKRIGWSQGQNHTWGFEAGVTHKSFWCLVSSCIEFSVLKTAKHLL